jgi:orotate phosphoribosyltransferase
LLEFIEHERKDEISLPCKLMEKIDKNYNEDSIYKNVIDSLASFIKENMDLEEIGYISGGERRDWFFSFKVADILGLPHLALFKDLKAISVRDGIVNSVESLDGKNLLHIVDLVNTASSHKKAWIPAIRERGGDIKWNISVVDRDQGGGNFFALEGIEDFSMIKIDEDLFVQACEMKIINKNQMEFIHEYIRDPDGSMRNFLINNPDFLENAIKSDNEKLSMRAHICRDANLYGLK